MLKWELWWSTPSPSLTTQRPQNYLHGFYYPQPRPRALNLVQHPLQATISENQEANENFWDFLEQYLMN